MSERRPFNAWLPNLEAIMLGLPGGLKDVKVVEETNSTQDAARSMGLRAGCVVVAWRQTAGRGRMGREWADTGEDGVAMTVVLSAEHAARLSIVAGLAAAMGIESACGEAQRGVRIKWPNDVVVNGRKIAGVLVECADGLARIGIGINVHQERWPDDLQSTAASLAQLGIRTDRLTVMIDVLLRLQVALGMNEEWLTKESAKRDVLTGTTCGFRIGKREIHGKVLRVDPMKGLAVQTEEQGEVWLPAATTTVIKEQDRRGIDAGA